MDKKTIQSLFGCDYSVRIIILNDENHIQSVSKKTSALISYDDVLRTKNKININH